jgi:hypothetical protein
MAWNVDGEFLSPKNITNGLNSLYLVLNAALCFVPFFDAYIVVSLSDIKFGEYFSVFYLCD